VILVWATLAFLVGAVSARVGETDLLLAVSLPVTLVVAVAMLTAAGQLQALSGKALAWTAAACCVLFVAGLANQSRFSEDLGDVPGLIGREVTLRGIVADEGDERGAFVRRRVELEAVDTGDGWADASGAVSWQASPFQDIEYGDLVELTGEIEEAPVFEDFDYRGYLARSGIGGIISFATADVLAEGQGAQWREQLYEFRAAFAENLQMGLPEPEAALATGIALGKRDAIPDELVQDLADSGLAHLIAVSGLNVTLVAAFAMAFAPLVGRRQAMVLAAVTIAGYLVMTGLTPSVVRSGIMGLVVLVALGTGRQANSLGALGAAACLMLLWDPGLLQDLGFQLSVAATAAIVVFASPVASWTVYGLARVGVDAGEGVPRSVVTLAAVSVVASIAVTPVLAYTFGRLSIVAVPANLLVEPLFPAMLLLATAGGILAYVPLLGDAVLLAAYFPLHYLALAAGAFAALPFAAVSLDISRHLYAALGLLILLALVVAYDRPLRAPEPASEPRLRLPASRRWAGAAACACIAAAAFVVVWPEDGSRLRVTFLDVGQGDAALVQAPSGERLLIDGGPQGPLLVRRLSEELPFWDRRIDVVLATHPQLDHIGGLVEVLRRYEVGVLYVNGQGSDSLAYRALVAEASNRGVPVVELASGDQLDLGDGAAALVLHPGPELAVDEPNERGLVVRVTYRDSSFLFTADVEELGELSLLASGVDLQSDVVKVPHHGGTSELTDELVAAVNPSIAVISAGRDNQFGHPTPETLDALVNIPIFRTDLHGTISMDTDGQTIEVRDD
jgi:competence protein ComEC